MIQDSVRNAVRLAFPKRAYVIFVSTDASEEFLADVITQMKKEPLVKSINVQEHEQGILGTKLFCGTEKLDNV